MPIYEEEGKLTREALLDRRKTNKCKECGGMLNVFLDPETHKAFLVCNDWHRTHHEGVEREASRYEKEGVASLNIPTRREIMAQDHGEEKTKALDKYISTGAITKAIATEIVETLWGAAPLIEKTKCILLCQTYQLNPLMKHLYLVGYRRKDKKGEYEVDEQGEYIKDWSIQIGIGATRLLAQRKHNYSYLDLTPRKATEEEIDKILGDTADPNSIYGFVHIKDIDTGAEAFGLRGIPKKEKIVGVEKGNTHLNQACIRAERLALDRQYPGEMPQGIEVVDERYTEAEYKVVDRDTSEIIDEKAAPKKEPAAAAPTKQSKAQATKPVSAPVVEEKSPAEVIEGEGFHIDLTWLKDSQKTLKWTDDTLRTFVLSKYKVDTRGTLAEVLQRLTREQAEEFVKEINKRLEKQTSLF